MLFGDFVFDISLLQTILFALFAIMTLFQGRLSNHSKFPHWTTLRQVLILLRTHFIVVKLS
ncbi:hypothetical protein [Leptospira santarosai]|uniref:hypothetical protein n=1 Tax=Leptospira santarosai TaxID=28183 RepID=UPI00349F1A54